MRLTSGFIHDEKRRVVMYGSSTRWTVRAVQTDQNQIVRTDQNETV